MSMDEYFLSDLWKILVANESKYFEEPRMFSICGDAINLFVICVCITPARPARVIV